MPMRLQPSPLGFAGGPFLGLPPGSTSRIARFGLWISVCWVTIFWRLSYLPLIDPDEAHYAEITREMRRLGDYLVPRIDGTPIIDKPALFHWLQAASFALFGENEFAARLPTALAALALIWTTYWLGKRLFGAETAERGALMLAMTPLTFALGSFAIFDMIFNAFLFGAFALLAVSAIEHRRWLQVPGFILLSLALQTKGPFVMIVVAATALVASLSPATRVYIRRIAWVPGLIGAGILALPWFVLMWLRFGDLFVRDYLLLNNLQLFAAPLYRSTFDPFFYVRSASAALFPWSLIVVGALIDAVRLRRTGGEFGPRRIILWSWIAVVFSFFSASRFKLDHYIYPIAPAVCLLAADAWQRVWTEGGRRYLGIAVSLALAAVLLLAVGIAGAVAVLDANLDLPVSSIAFPIGIALGAAAWLVTLTIRRFRPTRHGLPMIATLMAVYVTAVFVGLPLLKETRPGADLGVWLRTHVAPDDHIIVFRQGRWKASLRFYAQHPVEQTTVTSDLVEAWRRPQRVFGVMIERDLQVLRDAGLPFTIVHVERTVIGNEGRLIRKQIWGDVFVVTNAPPGAP